MVVSDQALQRVIEAWLERGVIQRRRQDPGSCQVVGRHLAVGQVILEPDRGEPEYDAQHDLPRHGSVEPE